MAVSDVKKQGLLKYSYYIIPCFLTVVIACIYAFGIWSQLNSTVLNILCLAFFFLELTPGLVERNNIKKALLFLSATFIGMVVCGLNWWDKYQVERDFWSSGFSGWNLLWMLLLFFAILSVFTILIRLFRWSQEQWEIVRNLHQKGRLNIKNTWLNYILSQNEHRLNMQQIKQNYQRKLREDKQNWKVEECEIKQKNRKKKLEFKAQKKENKRGKILAVQKNRSGFVDCFNSENAQKFLGFFKRVFSIGVRLLVTCIIIVGFFLLPYFDHLRSSFPDWISAVEKLVNSLRSSNNANGQQALLYYIPFYVFAVASILIVIYLVFHIVMHDYMEKPSIGSFFASYQTPIAILVVVGAGLYILTEGDFGISQINKEWEFILAIILLVLVVFAAVEIVRIVLDQCARRESLLRKLIYLVFIAILKLLFEILTGFIANINVQALISSIFSLVLPESKESESSFNVRIMKIIDHLFDKEMSEVENEDSTHSTSRAFHRKQIWRRNKK